MAGGYAYETLGVDPGKSGPGQKLVDGRGTMIGYCGTRPHDGTLAYWSVRALVHLGIFTDDQIEELEAAHTRIVAYGKLDIRAFKYGRYNRIHWSWDAQKRWETAEEEKHDWPIAASPIALLAHELQHAYNAQVKPFRCRPGAERLVGEIYAIDAQNRTMRALYNYMPAHYEDAWQGLDWIRPNRLAHWIGL